MTQKDIRWIQRFHNYRKALARLTDAVELQKTRVLSELEQQGLIQAFEFTYDLAWKTLQDLLRELGRPNDNGGPTIIIAQALVDGFIADGNGWKALKKSRENTSHHYDKENADYVANRILDLYHGLFIQLETRLQLEMIQREKEP